MTAVTGDGPQPLGQRPALDGVRGVAILAVMALHAAASYFPGGAVGVDVFFALSAFLITSLILEEVGRRGGCFSFKDFYVRRALRLGPALILWLALVAGPTAALAGQSDMLFSSTIASLLYFGNYALAFGWWPIADAHAHVWSLAIEEQFYAVWPLVLVVLLLRRGGSATRLALWVGLVASLAVFWVTEATVYSNYFLPTGHLVPLAAGCLAAHLFTFGMPFWLRTAVSQSFLPWAILAAVAGYTLVPYRAAVPIIGVGVGLLILHVCVGEGSAAARLLAWPILLWFGRRSYGLYLYHRTLAGTIPLLVPGITLKVAGPLVLALSCLTAEVSWRLVERPIARAGRARLARSVPLAGDIPR